ncbi:unnamed protein product [Rotaria socialis]|uniref:Uncharacterized protein n=2 Tax=Bdelloidea TaxID=44578 RepID=A0A821KEU6_9BILA|nr:unnamed protein product [Rotaria sp. Silwood2]CAF3332305.1 unnamed protein product [Rotaria socialis]CAF3452517.1 unnamed protein product [Rotaria sp. Silwood2]CAF4595887.1 unnamed protein product [Rotaria socialis]CAF4737055.1 unnamed protein product [Rotaria socialis]
MNPEMRTNERILNGPFSSVQVKNHLTQNHNQIHMNPLISLRDFHLHANVSKIPQFNITNIIQRPMIFLFKSHSIIQDFFLLFILLIIISLLFLVFYRRYTKSSLSNENSI